MRDSLITRIENKNGTAFVGIQICKLPLWLVIGVPVRRSTLSGFSYPEIGNISRYPRLWPNPWPESLSNFRILPLLPRLQWAAYMPQSTSNSIPPARSISRHTHPSISHEQLMAGAVQALIQARFLSSPEVVHDGCENKSREHSLSRRHLAPLQVLDEVKVCRILH